MARMKDMLIDIETLYDAGLSYKEIASELRISVSDVREYIESKYGPEGEQDSVGEWYVS